MIQKKKLVQFYLEQYEQAGKKRPKRSISTAEMQKRVQTLFRTLRSAKPGRVNVRLLEDYHRQLKNISVYAHRKNRADILKKLQEEVLPKLVSLDLGILLEEQKEGMDEIFLSWLQENHPGAICQETLFTLYPVRWAMSFRVTFTLSRPVFPMNSFLSLSILIASTSACSVFLPSETA